MRAVALAVAAFAVAAPPAAATERVKLSPQATVAQSLRATARTGRLPRTLLIRYDDVATRFGGDTFLLDADGRLTKTSPGPADAPVTRTVRTTRRDVLGVVRLLVRLEAWRQRTPPRRPLPDETRAYLTIRAGGAKTVVWEWYNDLKRNRRLSLVKARLSSSFAAASGG